MLSMIRTRMRDGSNPPIADLIGFRLTKIGRGSAKIELEASERHANPMGTLHGGVMCDIADAAMGMAYASTLGADESFTTMELKINFLRPVWSGHMEAMAKIVKKGRTTGLVICRVLDGDGRLVALATSTCMTITSPTGAGLTRERHSAGHENHRRRD
jgi:uncharacterized protein (TIGR00369 family)